MLATVIGERLNSRLAEIEVAGARDPAPGGSHHKLPAGAGAQPADPRSRGTFRAAAAAAGAADTCGLLDAADAANGRTSTSIGWYSVWRPGRRSTRSPSGRSLLVLVNVDFEVFLDRRRTERYVAACQALDTRLRERLVLVLSGMPKGFPKSRVLECVMRLRPLCHGVGFQSDGMEAPSVELSLLGAATVVLQEDRQAARTARDIERLGKLVDSLHAYQASVLVRQVASWANAKALARLGVDLIAIGEDEHEGAGPNVC